MKSIFFIVTVSFTSLSLFGAVGVLEAQSFFLPGQPDLVKAKTISDTVCAACHGVDGNSPISANPKISGQHPEYMFKQLKDFKSGDRQNAVMQSMVANLSEADMVSLAAYFSQKERKVEPAKNENIALGERLFKVGQRDKLLPACASCHGPAGAGIPALFPRISGQHSEYTESQLRAFRSQERKNDPNNTMKNIAIKLTDNEIKAVSNFIAGLRSGETKPMSNPVPH